MLPAPAAAIGGGEVRWRRFPTDEPWRTIDMARVGNALVVEIPHQPPAGKVEYALILDTAEGPVRAPGAEAVVARFRGDVPAPILIAHIVAMFGSMLVSTRTLFEVARPGAPRARPLILTTMVLLVVGGLILGPAVQLYAFGALWTGWPLGSDLTDTKTLAAVIAWLPATLAAARGARTRLAVGLGWAVMMAIFLIPHSLHGSQIDWSEHRAGVTTRGESAGGPAAAAAGPGSGR